MFDTNTWSLGSQSAEGLIEGNTGHPRGKGGIAPEAIKMSKSDDETGLHDILSLAVAAQD